MYLKCKKKCICGCHLCSVISWQHHRKNNWKNPVVYLHLSSIQISKQTSCTVGGTAWQNTPHCIKKDIASPSAKKHPVHVSINCIRWSGLGLGDLLSSDSERLCWRAGPFQLSVGLLFGSVAMAPPPEVEAGLLCALWTARVVVRSKKIKIKIWHQNHRGRVWWDLQRLQLHHSMHGCRADADSTTFSHQLLLQNEDRSESMPKFHLATLISCSGDFTRAELRWCHACLQARVHVLLHCCGSVLQLFDV